MNTMRTSTILLGILALLQASCSSDSLNREKAKELIVSFYEFPNVETAVFPVDAAFTSVSADDYRNLIDGGYLSFSNYSYSLSSTALGLNYKAGFKNGTLFVTNLRFFKEITGIRYDADDKTKATVEYSVERKKVTPFGEQKGYLEREVVQYSVACQKYDDGWRIVTKNHEENKSASDFPDVAEFHE